MNQRFYKRERLCSKYDIDRLFAPRTGGDAIGAPPAAVPSRAMAFPWRAVWLPARPECAPGFARILIMVPKRRLRHAVDRVTMRRRMREAYRRLRDTLPPTSRSLDVALVYVADKISAYTDCERSLRRLFRAIDSSLETLQQ